ncbi:MAG: DUF1656 domain-containing protein [Porticoccus sp.]|nr:DUF1656 domain-containing protein [Porticoccus sp.]
MLEMPREFFIGSVYLPPLLIVSILGILAASVTARLLNGYGLSRFFFYPPLAYVAIAIIYIGFFGTFVIRV